MFGKDFYPTPDNLITEMLEKIDLGRCRSILEPSAGRGDIVDKIMQKSRHVDLDTIEIDSELAMVLEGKGYKPIARDFLTFNTYRRYDAIVMNPPFSNGAEHLLKALKLQADGGQVVCLLNAETIKNPYTNERKVLVDQLTRLGASIDYIDDGFAGAARSTDVQIALIHANIPAVAPTSDILANLVEARKVEYDPVGASTDLVDGDYITGAVRRYEIETEAGLKFLREYDALKPILSSSFEKSSFPRLMIEIKVDGDAIDYGDHYSKFVNRVRAKYWQELFQSQQFSGLFTSKTRDDYTKRIKDLERFEFSIANIKQMQVNISKAMLGSLDESIVSLFDEFSRQHWDDQSTNIRYYNGWKTNKAYVVNRRVITHLDCFSKWDGTFDKYAATEKMRDLHKVFAYLDGKLSPKQEMLCDAIERAASIGRTKNVELPYCTVTFYKKGTAHITFKDERLLKKFNLIGSQRKGWLPSSYGQKSYASMNSEERSVVDEFEGEGEYNDTVANRDFYIERPVISLDSHLLEQPS